MTLWSLARPVRSGVIALLAISFFINLLILTLPIYMLQVFDRVVSTGHLETLFYLTLIALFAIGVHAGLEALRGMALNRLGSWLSEQAKPKILSACLHARGRGLNLGTRPVSEIDSIKAAIAGPALTALFDLPWLPVFIILFWSIHAWLGLTALMSALLLVLLTLLGDRFINGKQQKLRPKEGQTDLLATAALDNSTTVIGMAMERDVLALWSAQQMSHANEKRRLDELYAIIGAATRGFRLSAQIIATGLGAYLVVQEEISVGTILAVSILLGRALAPVDMLTASWRGLRQAVISWRRIDEVLALTPPDRPGITLPDPSGQVSVEGVAVAVDTPARLILQNISFSVAPGKMLGIIGASGCGKSTLCRTLLGIIPAARGSIKIDGARLEEWRREDFAHHIGYLPQRAEFLPGSLRDNIARFRDAKDSDIIKAAREAGVHELILSLPQGYDTTISAEGAPLSRGQQQRIGLARALFGAPKLIILDEAYANLDGEGSTALSTAMNKAKARGAAIISVVHNASMLTGVDDLLALENGTIKGWGPTAALLARLRADAA